MPYVRRNWQNAPSSATPLNAAALNNIEDGVEEAVEAVTGRLSEANLESTIDAVVLASGGGAFDVTGKTAAEITAYLAGGGLKKLSGAVTITAPIVIESDTYLDARAAEITSTHVGHMIRNTHYASGVSRDSNITILGGTWQRNAGGVPGTGGEVPGAGVAGESNGSHSLFLRHVDGLTVRGLTVGSTGGKYMIALGDVTNFYVADITGDVASDTVHMTGPCSAGVVERINMVGGDDVVAFTTTDYQSYNDVNGDISNVVVRDIVGTNSTRVVLVGASALGGTLADGHTLEGITIDTVTQFGAGAAVATGGSGNTDTMDGLTISHVRGGKVDLKHPNHGRVVISDVVGAGTFFAVVVGPDGTNTEANVDTLIIRDSTTTSSGAFFSMDSVYASVNVLQVENVTASGAGALLNLSRGSIGTATFRNCRYTGTTDVAAVGNASTITQLTFVGLAAVMNTTTRCVVKVNNTAAIGTVSLDDCVVSAVDTSTGIITSNSGSSGAVVTNTVINRGVFTGIGRFSEVASGSTGTRTLRCTNVTATGLNRFAQVGGGTMEFYYSNVKIASQVNEPLRFYNSAVGKIYGFGWVGHTAASVVRAGSEVINVRAADFPADLSILAKANGDQASNTNAGLACGVGPAVSNGTNWKNTYSGTTY